jgi:iron complex outermembrane receptor protein
MFRIRRVSLAVLAVCAGTTPLAAFAQQPTEQEVKRIEITGSRIKRIDTETAAPVQVITRDQIEKSGATSITEVLKSLPSNNAGSFDENAVASFTPGAGGVALRGLGAQATLVLINGRRVAPFGFASGGQTTFVDVNSIPLDAVERIDVLLDGASAIYGSDAMAGVINVILRKDFAGMQARGSLGQSAYGDATFKRGAVIFGKGSLASDRYNFLANLEHIDQDPVKASARPNTATSDFRLLTGLDRRSTYSYPGNLYTVGGVDGGGAAFIAPLPGCKTPATGNPALAGRCIYDFVQYTDVVAKSSRDSLLLAGTVELGGGAQFFSDLSLMRTKFDQQSASFSSSTYYDTNVDVPTRAITLPVGHPQNPGTTPVALRYRLADVPAVTGVVSNTQRFTLGVRGTVAGWDAESALLVSRSKTNISQTGYIHDTVYTNEVLDPANGFAARPTFIFGNPSANDAGLMARLYPTLNQEGKTSTSSADVRGNRDLMQLPGGPLAISVGLETRRESFKSGNDPLVEAGEISVLGGASSDGSRTVSAVYAELSAPVLKGLEAQLAFRTDRYSDFGSATTPKVGLKWKALPNLVLRSTYSEGFRAPALTELVQSPTRGFYSGLVDPKLCPDPTDTTNANCDISVEAIFGSNPNLKPEKSKSVTLGLVFEPSSDVSIAVDAYRIKRRNEITSIDPNFLLANEATYPGLVIRDPVTNEITRLDLLYSNLGSTEVWGYDVDVKGRIPLAEMGTLSLEASYNRSPSYKVEPVPGAPIEQWAGTYTQPKERFTLGANWEKGPWSTKLVVNYTGAYLRAFTSSDLSCPYSGGAFESLCSVNSWMTADLFVSYKGIKNLELGLSIRNLENKQAPIDQRRETRFTLFNSAYHNQLGRFTTLSAKYTFW